MDKAFILKNIDEAVKVIQAYPPALFNLSLYRAEHKCGTIYCAVGLLATASYFKGLGWGYEEGSDHPKINGTHFEAEVDDFFGPDADDCLFFPRGMGEYDGEILEEMDLTDQELALARLDVHRQKILKEL
jgi:hypothetical protein